MGITGNNLRIGFYTQRNEDKQHSFKAFACFFKFFPVLPVHFCYGLKKLLSLASDSIIRENCYAKNNKFMSFYN
jgi:hypothetical protein